ncbi:concanavalin A-like lectin/glucanase [Setomelanomma holmii]|uniref:chitinase n=1 Tax=Setomelanomma holmii TaxID=210430 RepID=A0A9P4LQC3_9PLEO|nr:concanavalin A-like lectin/glucanase [Setomelanomma holmii]
MKYFALSAVAALAALIPTSLAQTHTDCNPLNTTGCPTMQALGSNATFLFNKTGISSNGKVWRKQNQGTIGWDEKGGATFQIERSGDAPMVQSNFYMLFGRLEISEALDEIDWEFLGSNTTHAMTNYFGKGNTTAFDRGINYKMDAAPQDDFHNYTIDWTKDRIQWWIDDKMVRELVPAQALNGKNYPQTPMNVRLGAWAGGDTTNNDPGVVEWAGGKTDFNAGPFTMMVRQLYAQDYTSAKEYQWADPADPTGSWENIKAVQGGTSKVTQEIQKPSGVRNRWAALSQGAKIGIIAGSLGLFAILLCLMAFCCIKQRRAGRKEHSALLAEEQKEAAELQEYKRQMQSGKFGFGGGNYGRV